MWSSLSLHGAARLQIRPAARTAMTAHMVKDWDACARFSAKLPGSTLLYMECALYFIACSRSTCFWVQRQLLKGWFSQEWKLHHRVVVSSLSKQKTCVPAALFCTVNVSCYCRFSERQTKKSTSKIKVVHITVVNTVPMYRCSETICVVLCNYI